MMIANISPASPNLADTHSTLRFAQRVKAIRNTVTDRSPSTVVSKICRALRQGQSSCDTQRTAQSAVLLLRTLLFLRHRHSVIC